MQFQPTFKQTGPRRGRPTEIRKKERAIAGKFVARACQLISVHVNNEGKR